MYPVAAPKPTSGAATAAARGVLVVLLALLFSSVCQAEQLFPAHAFLTDPAATWNGSLLEKSTDGLVGISWGDWPQGVTAARVSVEGNYSGAGQGTVYFYVDGDLLSEVDVTGPGVVTSPEFTVGSSAGGWRVVVTNASGTTSIGQVTLLVEERAATVNVYRILFFLQCIAVTGAFCYGGVIWRLVVLAKNQRSFW